MRRYCLSKTQWAYMRGRRRCARDYNTGRVRCVCVANILLNSRKYKIPNYQNGHAYLTSHRICYVATEDPRQHSVAIDLKDVDRAEYQV
jgi:hypothetical protein